MPRLRGAFESPLRTRASRGRDGNGLLDSSDIADMVAHTGKRKEAYEAWLVSTRSSSRRSSACSSTASTVQSRESRRSRLSVGVKDFFARRGPEGPPGTLTRRATSWHGGDRTWASGRLGCKPIAVATPCACKLREGGDAAAAAAGGGEAAAGGGEAASEGMEGVKLYVGGHFGGGESPVLATPDESPGASRVASPTFDRAGPERSLGSPNERGRGRVQFDVA